MISDKQDKEIEKRVRITVELFLKDTTKSDIEIADVLCKHGVTTSSSTVGRDLTSPRVEKYYGEDTLKQIKTARDANAKAAKQKGGINSQANNNFIKVENGQFNGCRKK